MTISSCMSRASYAAAIGSTQKAVVLTKLPVNVKDSLHMKDSFAAMLRDWHNFYMLTGAAAATLMGLVFVATSLGTSLMKSAITTSGIRAFVSPTIIHFSSVLIIAALSTIPTHTYLSFGSLLGLGGVTGLGYVGIISA